MVGHTRVDFRDQRPDFRDHSRPEFRDRARDDFRDRARVEFREPRSRSPSPSPFRSQWGGSRPQSPAFPLPETPPGILKTEGRHTPDDGRFPAPLDEAARYCCACGAKSICYPRKQWSPRPVRVATEGPSLSKSSCNNCENHGTLNSQRARRPAGSASPPEGTATGAVAKTATVRLLTRE